MATIRSTPPRRPRCPFSVTLTSYQVGRPWMFDGKLLRGLTGIPIRRNDFANSSLADAEPEPFTLANLTTKSLSASMRAVFVVAVVISIFVGVVELAGDRVELELAVCRLVGEELLPHGIGGLADFRRWQAQFRVLRGKLHLAGAVQAPEKDEGFGNGAAHGQQAVVAQDESLVVAAQALGQAGTFIQPHARPFEVV